MSKRVSKRTLRNQQQTSSGSGSAANIPSPFSAPPERLKSFLFALDPAQIYVVHIDNQPRDFKRKIFTVPVLMNIGIVLILCWRLYQVLPTYLDLLMVSLGLPSPAVVDKMGKSNKQLGGIALKRAAILVLDFILFRYIGAWPFMFFFEQPVSPVMWRWRLGFRDSEVVVRVSRKWGADEFWKSAVSAGDNEIVSTNPIFQERILPAIDSEWMRERTGYMMMGRYFDLDFPAMLDAEQMIEKDEANRSDFAKAVFIHSDENGWYQWRIEDASNVGDWAPDAGEEEAREKMMAFKDQLIAMGKERLFYRWIELVQYESEQPQSQSGNRQERMIERAKHLFSQEGVDVDQLIASVGGNQGFPGLEKPA